MDQQVTPDEQMQTASTAISYSLTENDVIAFNQYHITHSPLLKRRQLITRVVLPLVLVLLAAFYYSADNRLFMPIYLVSLGVLVAVGAPTLQRRASARLMRKMLKEGQNRGLFGARTVTLTPNGVEVLGEALDSRFKWSLIEKVVSSDTHIFIYVSAMNAFVIPKTAFANDREREHFLEMAMQFREKAVGLR